ncbi:MAG: CbtA family protein [Silicimonas sp.]|jgi:cobalt transporter subunit CbtA|nr:CbtA family protein [Silicimonas sp.]
MFTRILTTALLAGAAAGLLAACLQLWFVQPVLIQAEMYESGELAHFGTGAEALAHDHADAETHEHSHGTPDDGAPVLPRPVLLILFNMLTYAGYSLVLVALMSLAEARGAVLDARRGILWGIAGFTAVMLAPGFSLAPEVPGVAAADVAARQIWWGATVAMAVGAMWLLAYGSGPAAWGAVVVLLAAPHMVGAPEPAAFTGPVPPEIAGLFAARVFGVGLIGWVLMGMFAGMLWSRSSETEGSAQAA